jgi:Methane oxygenase PmoA
MTVKTCLIVFTALCTPFAEAQVKFERLPDRIRVEIDGRPFTEFIFDAVNNKPYLYPIRSASGKIVSRHYPFEAVPGEDNEHPHHRGIWFTHGDVNSYDFWGSDASQKSPIQGRVLLTGNVSAEGGAKAGAIITDFHWLAPTGKTLLFEHRKTVFYSHPSLRMIDFDIELTAADSPVHFGDTKEGTFAVRVGAPLSEDHGGTLVASDGRKSEKEIWGTRADWIDDYGTVEGDRLGVAIFDHPSNPRHPTYWHARAYGLLAANIFGLHDFVDKSKDGGLTMSPGSTLRFRYRVVIHPGDTVTARIANLYKEFALTK